MDAVSLLMLVPLAGSLEFVSAVDPCCEMEISDEGVQNAMAEFAKHGGAPNIRVQ